MRILIVEWDKASKDNDDVHKRLKQYGYAVDRVLYGNTLLSFIQKEIFEVILLDLSLSKISELGVLRKIRSAESRTPVLILTAYQSVNERIKILDNGADDYLTKPVDLDELSARIRALQRRYANNRASPLLTYRDIELDPSTSSVTFKGNNINFSRREFSLLQKLLENVGFVVSRNSLNECLYGWADEIDSNTLEVHIHNIRKKLVNIQLIQTIRGIGYRVVKETA